MNILNVVEFIQKEQEMKTLISQVTDKELQQNLYENLQCLTKLLSTLKSSTGTAVEDIM